MSNLAKIAFNSSALAAVTKQITIKSSAFETGAPIPDRNSAYYENVSPALEWSNIPSATKSIVLIAEDPDAPRPEPFVHWLAVNLLPETTGLPENQPHDKKLGADFGHAQQGRNGFGDFGYLGPKPPPGHGVHHYHFQIFALDVAKIDLSDDFTLAQLFAAIKDHVIAKGELVGTYERSAE